LCLSICVSDVLCAFSFESEGKSYSISGSNFSGIEYVKLNDYLSPSGVKPVYNRILHKLSFKTNASVVILSPVSDAVCVKGKTELFKKPLIYTGGTFYISRQVAVYVGEALSYKINKQVIIIDPGHGGGGEEGLGAIVTYNGKKIYEKEITLKFSKIFGKVLEEKGYDVKYTRTKDVKIDLKTRTKMANSDVGEIYVSVHANASLDPAAKGADIFYMSEDAEDEYSKSVAEEENKFIKREEIPTDDSGSIVKSMLVSGHIMESSKLAYEVSSKLPDKIKNRGVKKAPFTVLSNAAMPAILVEIGFMSNSDDLKRLNNEKELRTLAESLADGISSFLSTYKGQDREQNKEKGK